MSYDEECYCATHDGQCVFCELATDARLERLAKSIAIGAALCRADVLGSTRMPPPFGHDWKPGCGRSAP